MCVGYMQMVHHLKKIRMTHSEMSPFCVFWMNQSVGGWTGWSAEYFSIFFFFLWGRGMLCSMGNLSSHQGLNPHPLQWKHKVLTTGSPGLSGGHYTIVYQELERLHILVYVEGLETFPRGYQGGTVLGNIL